MQKEDFKKEVTAFFSTSKLHELSAFLKENKKETVENKDFIKKLNKQLGQPFITATLTELEKTLKEERIIFLQSIDEALINNDKNALFAILKPLSFNEQYSDPELSHHFYYHNRDLHNVFIKCIIDNHLELNEHNQKNLKRYCIMNNHLKILDDLGVYYCNSTNNINDKITLLTHQTSAVIGNNENTDKSVRESLVNQLFDLLESHKSDDKENNPSTYFLDNLEYYIYLNEANANKIDNINKTLDPNKMVYYLANMNPSSLNHYLEKQDKGFKLDIPLDVYSSLIHKGVNLDKVYISNDSILTNEEFAQKVENNPRYILKIISDKKLLDFFNNQENKYTIPEKSKYHDIDIINSILWELNKDEVDTIFNKTQIFKLSKKQKSIVDNYLIYYEKNMLKTLNHDKDMPRNIGDRAQKEYIEAHINDKSFLQNLSGEGKKSIMNRYFDYSTIEDGQKFINDFLKDFPKEQYSCFHTSLYSRLEGNKNQNKIMSYLLNEKTEFNSHNIYHSLEFLHLFNDEKKKEMVGSMLSEKKERNHFETYYKHMEKDTRLNSQEKNNLKELKLLYDQLLSEKEHAANRKKKYNAKKR